MRAFIIPSYYPTPAAPTYANWILPHVECVRRAGIEPVVVYVDTTYETTDGGNSDGFVVDEGHRLVYGSVVPKRSRWLRTRFFFGRHLDAYTRRLRAIYRVAVERFGKPDIVHAHVSLPAGYGASLIAREEGLPVIVTEHYTGFESDYRFPWRLKSFLKTMNGRIDGFYAVSPAYGERILRTGAVDVTGVIPNPIDVDMFRPLEGATRDPFFHIVSAGGLGWRKGADVLLEALRNLPVGLDWRLTLFGGCDHAADYGQWLNDPALKGRIEVVGRVPQERLAEAYSRAGVYVVSSRIETANTAMLQAMACGLPVAVTRCGGPESLVDETVAEIAPSGDAVGLARAIAKVYDRRAEFDPRRLREFVVSRYGPDTVARMVREAYLAAAKNRENGRKTAR